MKVRRYYSRFIAIESKQAFQAQQQTMCKTVLIDLNTLLIHSPTTTYLVEVEGDSMIDMGIYPNDILIVDRSLSARNKDIVIALVDDGFTAKQLILGEHIILRAHNENYADIVVKGSLELFGVVVSSVRRFKR